MTDVARGSGADPRRAATAVWASALTAAAVVVGAVVTAGSGGGTGPAPPEPIRLTPAPLDQAGQSLDRCALALDFVGLATRYPERADWRPLAVLSTGEVVVTMLDGDPPFVCVTGPRSVAVSDPASAVPLDTAELLLSTPAGVLAAVAPPRESVEVTPVGTDPPGAARHFLRVTGTPISDADRLTATIDGPAGTRHLGTPERLAPPALDLVDRAWSPMTPPSTGTTDLLERCRAGAEPVPRPWRTAHVLPYTLRGQPAWLLVAISTGTVGGCSIAPDEVTPLRVWRVGTIGDGSRPFVWLPRPGQALPDLAPAIAAGPMAPAVARMEIIADGGRSWDASLAGGTFATRIPDGVTHDPRELTVRAVDTRNQVLYEGPAAD